MDIHSENPIRATIASTYLREMRESIEEVWRSLKVGGYFVLVVANNQICGREFKTQHYLANDSRGNRFSNCLAND